MKKATSTESGAEFIRYLWIVIGQRGIEMAGRFTPERWEQFCKRPHPIRHDVSILRLQ